MYMCIYIHTYIYIYIHTYIVKGAMRFADEWNSGSRRQELRKEFEGALRTKFTKSIRVLFRVEGFVWIQGFNCKRVI